MVEAGPGPAFVSLEETRRLAVLAAHQTIASLTVEPILSLGQAQLLRGLVAIINDAEELEIKKFMITRRPPGGADRAPDPAGAEAIAAGEQAVK